MNILIVARNGIQARRVAEKECPEFYYSNCKKISRNKYRVTMLKRKVLMNTGDHLSTWTEIDIKFTRIDNMFAGLKQLIKNTVSISKEERKIVKGINTLCRDIKNLVEE